MPSTFLSQPSRDAANLATLRAGGPFAFDLAFDQDSSHAHALKSVTIADAALREAVGRAYRAAQAYRQRIGAERTPRACAVAPCAVRGPLQQAEQDAQAQPPARNTHAQTQPERLAPEHAARRHGEQAWHGTPAYVAPTQKSRAVPGPLQQRVSPRFDPHAVRQVLTYHDEPATCSALGQSLAHYRYFLGEAKSFALDQMAAIGLPLVVWQNIFSRAKKRVELGQPLHHPAAYCLEAGRRERPFVRCRKGPLASAPIFKPRTFVGTPAGSGQFRALSALLG